MMIFREFALRGVNAVSLRPRADTAERLAGFPASLSWLLTGRVHDVPGSERLRVTHLSNQWMVSPMRFNALMLISSFSSGFNL